MKKKQSLPSNKAQPQIGQAIKERETKKWSRTDDILCKPNTIDTSSRQILDIHEKEARTRPKSHQLVPNQYRTR